MGAHGGLLGLELVLMLDRLFHPARRDLTQVNYRSVNYRSRSV